MKKNSKNPRPWHRSHFLLCDCFTHSLQLSWIEETDSREIYSLFLAFWRLGEGKDDYKIWNVETWRWRLRAIWNIFSKGSPYDDMLSLSCYETKRMIKVLQAFVREAEQHKKRGTIKK